jgi:hypothetical protein
LEILANLQKKILLRFSEIPDQEAFYLTGEIEVTPKIGHVSLLVLLFYYRNYRNYVPLNLVNYRKTIKEMIKNSFQDQ